MKKAGKMVYQPPAYFESPIGLMLDFVDNQLETVGIGRIADFVDGFDGFNRGGFHLERINGSVVFEHPEIEVGAGT